MNIVQYTVDDAVRISRFMRKHFQHDNAEENRSHEAEYYAWKYAENPAGTPLVRMAEDGGEVGGLYAVVPKRMKIGSQNTIGY